MIPLTFNWTLLLQVSCVKSGRACSGVSFLRWPWVVRQGLSHMRHLLRRACSADVTVEWMDHILLLARQEHGR